MENDELIINTNIEPTPEPFVIPNIYNYNPITKEFTGVIEQADKDNAKSAQVGYFVPMVHANATLIEPPKVNENEIQVYSKTVETHKEPYEIINPETGEICIEYKDVTETLENWTIESDYRKNFYKIDEYLNIYDITTIGEQIGFIIVPREIGDDIKINKNWYKIIGNDVIKKSDEEYEQEKAEKEAQRVAMLHLTRGDVFRGLLQAKGITRVQLRAIIETLPEENQEQSITKEMALIDFDEALEFYRGNALIDMVGAELGITPKQMTKFFETKDWHELKAYE